MLLLLIGIVLERVIQYLYYKVRYTNSSQRIPQFVVEPGIIIIFSSIFLNLFYNFNYYIRISIAIIISIKLFRLLII